MANEWEQFATVPNNTSASGWEQFASAETPTKASKENFVERVGKQFYNSVIAQPASVFGVQSNIGEIKTDVNSITFLEDSFRKKVESGEAVTEEDINAFTKPYKKGSLGSIFGVKQESWKDKVWNDFQSGKIKTKPFNKEEAAQSLQSAMVTGKAKTITDADISFIVSEASGRKDKAADVIGAVGGFVTQLAVLRKTFPNVPPIMLWELQGQASGSTPGSGALMYGVYSIPGKIIPGTSKLAKVGRTATESAFLGTLNAVEQEINTGQIDWEDVAINAGVPVGLKTVGFLKAGLRLRSPKAVNAIQRYTGVRISDTLPEEGLPQVGIVRRVQKALPEGTRPKEITGGMLKALPEGRKRGIAGPGGRLMLPMTDAEAIDRRASQIYDRLISRGETGEKKAYKAVSNFVQGQKFPTLDELYERVGNGDTVAAEMVQDGIYASSPEAFVEGLRVEAAKELGLHYSVSNFRNKFNFLTGKNFNKVQEVARISRSPGVVPNPQANVFTTESGQLILDERRLKTRKVRGKEFPFANENELYDPETKQKATLQPDLTRGRNESEGEYLDRVYGPQKKTVIAEILRSAPSNEPEVVMEFGDEYRLPWQKDLPGGGTMTEPTEPPKVNKKIIGVNVKGQPTVKVKRPVVLPVSEVDTVDSLNKKLRSWVKKVKIKPKKEQEAERSKLRRKQASGGTYTLFKSLESGMGWGESIRASKAAYKHKMRVVEVEPPDLTDKQWDVYSKKISELYPPKDASKQFQRTNTQDALDKLRNGGIPTNYQFELLEPLFGKQTVGDLYKNLAAQRQYSLANIPSDIIQLFKWKFNWDVQTFRQGRSLAARHPIVYIKSVVDNIRAIKSEAYADRVADNIKNSPNFATSEQYLNYVADTGYSTRKLEYYGTGWVERMSLSKHRGIREYGQTLKTVERGATVGINSMMKRLWDIGEKELSRKIARTPMTTEDVNKWRLNRGKTINTFMKILRSKNPTIRELQRAMSYILYSPSMTASRPLSLKAIVANKGSRLYAGEIIASNIASIFLCSAIPAVIGHALFTRNPDKEPEINGGVNPLNGDLGKIRVKSEVADLSMGDAPFYRTLARLGVSAYLNAKQLATGKEQTTFAGKKVQPFGETLNQYLMTRETAALGYAKAIVTGKDWLGQPIGRLESTVRALTPEVIESMYDAGIADGLWAGLASATLSEMSVGMSTYPVPTFTTKSNYENEISKREYGKIWDDLNKIEQNRLNIKYRTNFEELNRKAAAERIGKPFDPSRIIEDERQAGVYIRKHLTPGVKGKLAETSLNISRSPGELFLNDERYQRYKDLIAERLNERLKDYTPRGSNTVQKEVLDTMIDTAKEVAFVQLQKEMRAGL